MQSLNGMFTLALLAAIFGVTALVQAFVHMRWLEKGRAVRWLLLGLLFLTGAGGLIVQASQAPFRNPSTMISAWGPDWQCLSQRGLCFKRPVSHQP